MTNAAYVSAIEAGVDLDAIAHDLAAALGVTGPNFRPLAADLADTTVGTTPAELAEDHKEAMSQVAKRHAAFAADKPASVIVGTSYEDVTAPVELALNAELAAHLDAPVVIVLKGDGREAAQLDRAAAVAVEAFRAGHAQVIGVLVEGEQAALSPIEGIVTGASESSEALAKLAEAVKAERSHVRTPISFENELMARAAADQRTIVLPESGDDRIIESASIILERGVAKIVLLGKADQVNARAAELGCDVSGAQIVDMDEPTQLEKFAAEYARLRAKKGVTIEQAKEKLKDASYYGTMMVHFGMADGMVSGAVNTTANTIRPSLEFIKTKPGIKVVSGAFLMCMADEVKVYADCAVNPNPTPEQLADIAISSAETAQAFGIEPRVAMISYSTGESGKGPDVDAVREATQIAQAARPDLKIEGPIQFDASVDPVVGAKKMPGSEVAGRATVLVFPDLNTGNACYKAVQRTSGAVAVGPALQGLNCPVNDLSRGALVADIVSTVALTAIQAQATPAGTGSPLREA